MHSMKVKLVVLAVLLCLRVNVPGATEYRYKAVNLTGESVSLVFGITESYGNSVSCSAYETKYSNWIPWGSYWAWFRGGTNTGVSGFTALTTGDVEKVWNGGAPAPEYRWYKCITNTTPLYADVHVVPDARFTNSYYSAVIHLRPGEHACWTLTQGSPFSAHLHGSFYDDMTPPVDGDTDEEEANSDEEDLDPLNLGPDDKPLYSGPSGSNGATGGDIGLLSTNLQKGLLLLGSGVGRGLGDVKGELVDLNRTAERIRTNTIPGTNDSGLDSGLLGQIATNTALTAGRLSTVTNELAGLTNFSSVAYAAQTNAEGALSWATAMMTNGGWRIGQASNYVAQGVPSLPGGADDSAFRFEFCGREIDLNPNSSFASGILDYIRKFWTWFLLISFAFSVGSLLWSAVMAFAASNIGGLPSFGALGIAATALKWGFAVMVATSVTIIWNWVADLILGGVMEYLGMIPDAASDFAFGGGSGLAVYLLVNAFPLSLALGLLGARLSLQFGMSGIVFVAASASRMLVGR